MQQRREEGCAKRGFSVDLSELLHRDVSTRRSSRFEFRQGRIPSVGIKERENLLGLLRGGGLVGSAQVKPLVAPICFQPNLPSWYLHKLALPDVFAFPQP